MNVTRADVHPRVSGIFGHHSIYQTLIDKGYAYEADGDVYFSTRKTKITETLGQNIDDLKPAPHCCR